jgi:hypothetical protein
VKAGDSLDAVASQTEDKDPGRSRDRLFPISEVAAKGRLIVRAAGEEVDAALATEVEAGLQEGPDGVRSAVLVRRGRHRQPGVVGEQSHPTLIN